MASSTQGRKLLTEADIPDEPPKLTPPIRALYRDDDAFQDACRIHEAAAAARADIMKQRRKIKERLREQGRDRSDRVRPASDNERRVKQRRQQPQQIELHNRQEARRYEAVQLPPTERDIAAAEFALARGGQAPGWGRVTKQAQAAASARYRERCLAGMLDRVGCDVADTVEDLLRTLERRAAFANPDLRLYMEERRLARDFKKFGAGVDVSRELAIAMGDAWVNDILHEDGAFDCDEDRRDFELLTYIGLCVPRCHLGTPEQDIDWLAWDENGVPLVLPTWARWSGCDEPGPAEMQPERLTSSSYDGVISSRGSLGDMSLLGPNFDDAPFSMLRSLPYWARRPNSAKHVWPAEWWTFRQVDEHCHCQAKRWLSMHASTWHEVPGLLCEHCAFRWHCSACRDALVREAIDLRFVGGGALRAWLYERECEHIEYVEWCEGRVVLNRIVSELERTECDAQRAAQEAAAAAAAAAVAAAKQAAVAAEEERIAAELAAAGLERITETNAARYPPPKLWTRNRRKDTYLHVRIMHKCEVCDMQGRSCTCIKVNPDAAPKSVGELAPGYAYCRLCQLRHNGAACDLSHVRPCLDVSSPPAIWYWQLTGIHVIDGDDLLDHRNNRYDKAVREWHKLMRRRPPKRYRTDHRGRGGQTAYMLRERLEPAVTTTTDAVAAPSTAAAAASTQPEPDEETDYETDYEDEGLATEGMYNDDDSDGGFGYDF